MLQLSSQCSLTEFLCVREVLDSLKDGGMDDVDDESLHLTGVVTLNLGVLLLKVCADLPFVTNHGVHVCEVLVCVTRRRARWLPQSPPSPRASSTAHLSAWTACSGFATWVLHICVVCRFGRRHCEIVVLAPNANARLLLCAQCSQSDLNCNCANVCYWWPGRRQRRDHFAVRG